MLGPHKRTIPGSEQKLRVDQRAKQCVARRAIHSPQPLRLRRGQAETRHLNVFTLHASQLVIVQLLLCHSFEAP